MRVFFRAHGSSPISQRNALTEKNWKTSYGDWAIFCPLVLSVVYIQLFRERLSEKAHATIPKGIVGGFEFTVLQRNLKK